MGNPLPNLNGNIRAEMARSGITQGILASRLDMSQSAISRRLIGDADWTVDELVRAAEVLGCPLRALLPEVAA
jgi:transcriptional regulator with XRE-family HTH domain